MSHLCEGNKYWNSTESRFKAFQSVYKELDRQIELVKQGKIPKTCEQMATDPFYALAVLTEEVGEVARALQREDKDNFIEELTQVAAVAIAWLSGVTEEGLKPEKVW